MPTSLLSTGVQFPDNSVQGIASNYILRAYTAPATWTKPTGLKAVKVTVQAGGGGGGCGAVTGYSEVFAGAGGAGGSAIRYIAAPAIAGPISVTVGSGGTGAPSSSPSGATNGGAGGSSSFGPLASATGGAGGTGNSPTANQGTGGDGGIGSSGTANIRGGAGQSGVRGTPFVQSSANMGGASLFGGGGKSIWSGGQPGQAFGSGGGGTNYPFTGTGGAGAAGIVLVEEFY